MDEGGVLHPQGTRTPQLYFFEDSKLRIEWTNGHGCGNDPRAPQCNIVLQYACEDTLEDDCGEEGAGKTCGPRDGRPITNIGPAGSTIYRSFFSTTGTSSVSRAARDAQATSTIPDSISHDAQSDFRFSRHESLRYYEKCYRRERNKGLWTGDLSIGDRATSTRQENGGRYGFECQEEADYYPYWAPSPWKDIAVLTFNTGECNTYTANSQNNNPKYECVCPNCITGNKLVPNNAPDCATSGGTWTKVDSHGLPAPHCGEPPTSRGNELTMSWYDWVVPKASQKSKQCTIRIRYNITTRDGMNENAGIPVSVYGTYAQNKLNSPINDRSTSESKTYLPSALGEDNHTRLGLATNTRHYGRMFQDRTYMFTIKPRSLAGECATRVVHNLNVRGKRGNIVQTFPAVEYDFTPNELYVDDLFSCVHVQWTGSDYNRNRNANDAYGGTPDPRNLNDGRSDRHNMVQMYDVMEYQAVVSLDRDWNMFSTSRQRKVNLAFINQPIENTEECMTIESILALSALADTDNNAATQNPLYRDKGNNFLDDNNDRDRYYKNCGKLSGAKTPYFDGGLFLPGPPGKYGYFSTRGNSFSNRNQQGMLIVQSGLVTSGLVSVVLVGGLGLLALAGVLFARRRSQKATLTDSNTAASKLAGETMVSAVAAAVVPNKRAKPNATPVAGAGGSAFVTALYDHMPSEAGELAFKRGDIITVLNREDPGWWEGRSPNGNRGIFPSNYVS